MGILLYFLLPFHILTGKAQGTTYTIKYVAERERICSSSLDSIYQEVDKSLSLYLPSSRINTFNKQGWVVMDDHMKKVIKASLECYRSSYGAFDITAGSIFRLWGFGDKASYRIPTPEEIKKVLAITGSHLLTIKGDTLKAIRSGVKIDCNGIAQGYTVDVISNFLIARGITQFMVELGGEIFTNGMHPETETWKVGIEGAESIAGNWYPVQRIIDIKDQAITTSGISRNAFSKKGQLYSHIIDPKKGRPINNNILSVTVMAKDALTADAWDNALLVMGLGKIKASLKEHPELGVYVIYRDEQGRIQEYSNIKK